MGDEILRRQFVIGDLVTIAPDFRNGVTDFDFEKYLGIVVESPEENEYVVYWTRSPSISPYRGMWNGDHLVRVEEFDEQRNFLHSPAQ